MKPLFIYVFIFFLLGIVFYHTSNILLLGAVISALFLMIILNKNKELIPFLILFFIIGIFLSRLHYGSFERKYEMLLKEDSYEGYILEAYENSYIVKNYKKDYKVSLSLYKNISIKPGDYICFEGNVKGRPIYKKNKMNSMNLNAYISGVDGSISITKKKNFFMFPVKIKYKIIAALMKVEKKGGSFIAGLVSGYTDGIDYRDEKNFNDMGISHILAVSGFNIGIIYFFITILTRKLSAKIRYNIIFIACLFYTAISGFQPSVTRALLMICITLFAKLINRYHDVINGITLTALIMLVINSYYIFNAGFILSFAATYGIIILKNDILDKMPERINRFRDEIAVTLSATTATFPLIVDYKGVFSMISCIINIIIAPLISLLTIISFISVIIYIIFNSEIVLYPCVFLGSIFLKIIRVISFINIPIFIGRPSKVFIILYYLLLGLYFGYFSIRFIEKKLRFLEIAIILIMLFSLIYKKPLLKIHTINVGQGESIFIVTPSGRTVLIDTGPEYKNYIAAKDKVIPFINLEGCGKIDILIITHFHSDHAGGINYVMENIEVGKLMAFSVPENYKGEYEAILGGDKINIDDVSINILYPKEEEISDTEENENCLVMELTYKEFSMLLTADAEGKVMNEIKGNYDLYKVPHHGSRLSHSKIMLDNSSIQAAIISVGKNSFGHPSREVIGDLKNRSIEVFRTDEDGNISIITDGKTYRILSQSD